MRNIFFILAVAAFAAMTLPSCEGLPEDGDKEIQLTGGQTQQTVGADDTQGKSGISFTVKGDWTVDVIEKTASRANNVSWIKILLDGTETYSGSAGDFTLTIGLDPNPTDKTRSATITIACGEDKIIVTITQGGTTGGGDPDPKPSKLIASIVESASFNSDQGYGYFPWRFEFKYDAQDKLREFIMKLSNDDEKIIFDHTIQGELRLSDGVDDYNNKVVPLDSRGRVTMTGISDSYYKMSYAYSESGYLDSITPSSTYQRTKYQYIWENGNPVTIRRIPGNNDVSGEWDEANATSGSVSFTQELNDKTNIDLNAFFFGPLEGVGVVRDYNVSYADDFTDEDFLCAFAGLTGKRARNYMTSIPLGSLASPTNRLDIYTESTLPATGSVVSSSIDSELYGEGSYTFDSEGWPTAFAQQRKVTKTLYTYNGNRTALTASNDYLGHNPEWLERQYGPGPWYTITLDEGTPVVKYDTYTWTISYNK